MSYITICDSYTILNSSLAKLCKDFNVEHSKGLFPHSFSNENTLNYIGPTPNIECYKNISQDVYNLLYTDKNWSFKDESIKYLNLDLLSLFQVIKAFNHHLFLTFGISITDGLTISSIASRIFFNNYYNNSIPLINKLDIYSDIKQSYYGGCTEVYKPYGNNLNYYDVNSLYPYSALNDMPGTKVQYLEGVNKKLVASHK
uniref:Probable DNA polymerase n=1 Tax=Beauveria lii TaxID=1290591 RepID=A0A7S6PVW1_9HYPO|nr:hypothetical protein J2C28_mgp24 [Beauveria lii]QOU11073.1 hypothetical protein [Beauveria lii]